MGSHLRVHGRQHLEGGVVSAAAIEVTFRKNSDEIGNIWIGDGLITEKEAHELAATVIPDDWEIHSTVYHYACAWVVLACHKEEN